MELIGSKKRVAFLFAAMALILFAGMPHSQTTTSPSTAGCGLLPSSIQLQIQTNEPWYCPINQQLYGQWANDLPIAFIAVLISFLVAAVIFMVGVAFGSDRIRNFGIGEFYEAVATAIIVGAFLYICAVIFGILPAFAVGTINPYATSLNLISTTISAAQNMYGSIFNAYMSVSFSISQSITPNLGGPVSALAKTLVSSLPQIIINIYSIPATIFFLDPAQAIAAFISDGISILYAEYYLMIFFAIAAIPAFLIPGVILRSLFPTRAVGGILIAFAIGFYLVMPTLFAVAFYFTVPSVLASMQAATFQVTRFSTNPAAASQALTAQSPLALQLNNVRSSLDGFWLLILFYPALIIAMTYTVIQEISRFLGGGVAGRAGSLRRFI